MYGAALMTPTSHKFLAALGAPSACEIPKASGNDRLAPLEPV